MPKSSLTLSQGNRKIKNANIWNLPTGITCKSGVLCSTYCYAKKAEKMYPSVRPSRMRNYKASKKITFVLDMYDLLIDSKFKVTRIHESGDFYSKEYIEKWYQIAKNLPKHKFYAYTKRDDLFTKELLDSKPKNLILIYSIDGVHPDKSFPILLGFDLKFDKIAMIMEHKTNCPSTSKDGWAKACIRDCTKCIDKKTITITFAKH